MKGIFFLEHFRLDKNSKRWAFDFFASPVSLAQPVTSTDA